MIVYYLRGFLKRAFKQVINVRLLSVTFMIINT